MQINKDNFRSARFTDNERTIIEIMLADRENVNVYSPYVIELDPNHPDYKQLMKVTNLPEIHDYTDKWCTEQRKRFKEEILDIAKREGILKPIIKTKTEPGKVEKVEVEVQVNLTQSQILEKIYSIKL